jgi:hypothetical protein
MGVCGEVVEAVSQAKQAEGEKGCWAMIHARLLVLSP